MPSFRYQAIGADGAVIAGQIDAASAAAVAEKLQASGALLLRAEALGGSLFDRRSLSSRERMLLTRSLSTLLGAGLPLDRALEIVVSLAESAAARRTVEGVLARLKGGGALADALAEEGFPRAYVGMVRAGEASGALDTVFARLADFLERSQALRESVVSALVYPALLLVMALVSVVILLTVVVPQFEPLFQGAGAELPLLARLVLGAADAAGTHGWVVPLLAAILFLGWRWQRGSEAGRQAMDARLLKLPLVGSLLLRLDTARFARMLATLLANGVPLLGALSIARETLGNAALASAVAVVAGEAKEGRGLSEPLARARVFPPLVPQLLRVGEETGRLDEMLGRVADIYDQEVKTALSRLLALLVPLLTIGVGGIVAAIIGAILTAVMSVYDLPL